jgi:hypothetical protein
MEESGSKLQGHRSQVYGVAMREKGMRTIKPYELLFSSSRLLVHVRKWEQQRLPCFEQEIPTPSLLRVNGVTGGDEQADGDEAADTLNVYGGCDGDFKPCVRVMMVEGDRTVLGIAFLQVHSCNYPRYWVLSSG